MDTQGAASASGFTRPNNKRTFTGFGPDETQNVQASIPKAQRTAWAKHQLSGFQDTDGFEREVVRHVETTLARTMFNCDESVAYSASSLSFRDRLVLEWNRTQQRQKFAGTKRVYYLSSDFMMGKALDNAMLNIGLKDVAKSGLANLGFRIEDILDQEHDAACGNGDSGRLAACFLDSLASLNYSAWGYGLAYQRSLYKQELIDGQQVEIPDNWLNFNPWELARHDVTIDIQFYGHVQKVQNSEKTVTKWEGGEIVKAVAYDVPIPGYGTPTTNNLRLWSSKSADGDPDFQRFSGKISAIDEHAGTSPGSSPNECLDYDKELCLKQQYFWVAASLHDIVRRFKKSKCVWADFPNQVAIQLNDTCPGLAIIELQRILIDLEGLEWNEAWSIIVQTFGYTNRAILPEAFEKLPVSLMRRLLPRHLEIILDINSSFLQAVKNACPNDPDISERVSIIEESQPDMVRMTFIAIVGSHKVNNVSEIQNELVQQTIFKDFITIYGLDKFTLVSNGITPRRWLHQANPRLSKLLSDTTQGYEFLTDLGALSKVESKVDDESFRKEWAAIKRANKVRLGRYIEDTTGITIIPTALFDVQVSQIHEQRRQQLNVFGIIYRYLKLKGMEPDERKEALARVSIFSGKMAPGDQMSKQVVRLIKGIMNIVNNDKDTAELLKVVFIEDYNVSKAEMIIPAADISEHISTPGIIASETSNMKSVLNGSLIIGTCDGTNFEIAREIGDDNMFLFGCLADDVKDLRFAHWFSASPVDSDLSKVFEAIEEGTFGEPGDFSGIISAVRDHGDYYLVSEDFNSYIRSQSLVEEVYKNQDEWVTKSITSVARMGFFSSDRCIDEYAEGIWNVKPLAATSTDGP